MEKKLTHSKWFLYLTEFFAGMSVMAVELGASRLMAPYLYPENHSLGEWFKRGCC